MNRLLLTIGLAVLLFSCSEKSGSPKVVNEMLVGECLEMEWGQCKLQEKEGNTYLYLEVTDWPQKGMLSIPGLKMKVKDIYLQSQPKHHFAWRFYKGDFQIHASSFKPDETNSVLIVKTKGKVKVAGNPAV